MTAGQATQFSLVGGLTALRQAAQPLLLPCLRASRMMVDKLTAVSKERLGTLIGRLDDEDVMRLNRAMLVFLGSAPGLSDGGDVSPC